MRLEIGCSRNPDPYGKERIANDLRRVRKQVLQIDPNSRKVPNGFGEELLHWAAEHGYLRLVDKLLDARVIDYKSPLVADSLCWAIRHGDVNMTTFLLSLGIEFDKEIFGKIEFQWSVERSVEMISSTPRGTSGQWHYFEVIKLLLGAGANVKEILPFVGA